MTPGPLPRFTLDGSDALESRLAHLCDDVHVAVSSVIPPAHLQAILLGGGYGRGEGGVLRTPDGDQPYNDLEFYVFTRGPALVAERRFRRRLHRIGEKLSAAAGIDVEFKVITFAKLRRSPPSMFDYDLVARHRWIVGDEDRLRGCEHHLDPCRIPLHEATRLLMNRCTGLLFAAERLARPGFSEDDADFVGRNLAKARLAFGDAFLTAHGQYHWSCRERHARLQKLAHVAADVPPAVAPGVPPGGMLPDSTPPEIPIHHLVRLHADGVDFKLHPVRSDRSREELAAHHASLSAVGLQLWLWLEHRRLGQRFTSASDYARSGINKCPESSMLRNLLINLRTFGPNTPLGFRSFRYPRERLLHSLPLLLWEPSSAPPSVIARQLRRELFTRARDLPRRLAAYTRLWHRFN